MPDGVLRRLFRGEPAAGTGADGAAAAVHAAAAVREDVAAAAPARPGHRPVAHPDTIIAAALAQKLLHGWMQNRYQTRYPLTLKLANQTPEEAALLMAAARQALAAVGASEEDERRAAAWLATIGGQLPCSGSGGMPFAGLQQAKLTPQAYAVCAGTLGRRTAATRRFLHFLAARLSIPDEVARSLNRRFAR